MSKSFINMYKSPFGSILEPEVTKIQEIESEIDVEFILKENEQLKSENHNLKRLLEAIREVIRISDIRRVLDSIRGVKTNDKKKLIKLLKV